MNAPVINNDGSTDLTSAFYKDRIVFVTGEIEDKLAESIVKQLLMLDSLGGGDIAMYINSPGGSVSAGLAIYDTIQHVKSDVSTVGVGMCASMGAFLLMAGTHGKRYVLPHTQVLIHQPLGGVKGQATEIQIVAERIIETRRRINELMVLHTGQDILRIQADTERDYCMWAEEAVAYGIADSVKKPDM